MTCSVRPACRIIAGLFLVVAFFATLPSASAQNSDLLSRKMVWAHEMACYPLHMQSLGTDEYGSLYPLALEYSSSAECGDQQAEREIESASSAGIDAFDVDIFTDPCSIERFLDAADFLDSSLPAGQPPFLIAPTLDLSVYQEKGADNSVKEAAALAAIEEYCALAQAHPSAAMNDGEFVVFNYGTSQLPPGKWVDLRERLAADGYATYWVANLGADGLSGCDKFSPNTLTQYLPAFESSFMFGNAGKWWPNLLALYAQYNHPFAGGMMPGYNREPDDGYDDPDGTALYRNRWDRNMAANLPWIHTSTWNDMSENTNINPTSDWNTTRTEITAFDAALFKGQQAPFDTPRLYVTTPKAVTLSYGASAEALVLNPTGQVCHVAIELFNGNGNAVGKTISVRVDQLDGCANIALHPTSLPAGGYFRVKATLHSDGQILAEVWSAPILVFPKSTGDFQTYLRDTPRIEYYSIPANAALPGTVGLSIQAQSGDKTTAEAKITPPDDDPVRFVELLHDDREVYNFGDQKPFKIKVPTGKVTLSTSVTLPDTHIAGYWVARVIDSDGRVGYSDPVIVP